MKIANIALLLVAALVFAGCGQDSTDMPETLVLDYDQSEMDTAMQKAKDTLPEFLVVLKSGEADSFSVKAPITDDNGTEYFWISDITYGEGEFVGTIGNDPGVVENVTYGQAWTVAEGEIADWMFTRGRMIHGGFTIDPLLSESPEDLALKACLVR